MDGQFDIQDYMTKGVERVVADALRATLKNPRESAYIVKFASSSKKASRKRKKAEKNGEHIPPFLIASITFSCNLLSEVARIREQNQDMVYVSFPGDEKSSGGCVLFEKRDQVEAVLALLGAEN